MVAELEKHHPDMFWYGVHPPKRCSRSWERVVKPWCALRRLTPT